MSSSSFTDRKAEAQAAKKAIPQAISQKPEWTVGHLYNAFEALNAIANEKFEPRASAKILKLVEWIRPYYEDVTETRKAQLVRLGTEVEEGKYNLPAEHHETFNSVMKEATAEKVSIPERLKLSIEDLTGARISPATLNSISCIVSDL